MKNTFKFALLIGAVALSACTQSKRAREEATWSDRPADITCWTHGAVMFNGRSTGKVEYDNDGRASFVDAATNRFTTINGDCRVVYQPKVADQK